MKGVRNSGVAIATLIYIAYCHSCHGVWYGEVPDPPLNTQVMVDDIEEFLNSEDKIGIVYLYASSPTARETRHTDFAIISKILESNPKCKLGMSKLLLDTNASMEQAKPSYIYKKDGELITFTGKTGKMSEVLAWITKEDICEMRLPTQEHVKYYVRSLEPGYVHTYMLLLKGSYSDGIVDHVRDTVVSMGLRVPFMVVNDEECIHYVLRMYQMKEDALTTNAVVVARNIPTVSQAQFYVQSLDDHDKLRAFLLREINPPIHGTNFYMFDEILTMGKTLVYIYTKNEDLSSYIDVVWLNKFARRHNDRFLFIHSKGDGTIEKVMNDLLVIDTDYVETAVRAFQLHPEKSEFMKYKPLDMKDGSFTATQLMTFIHDLRNGRIRHFVKSEPAVPLHIDVGQVKTIVGEDFNHRVIDSDEDVLVLFFSPWCGHCHHAKRVFRDLGRRAKAFPSLIVAIFDAFNNEVEGISFNSYPTIMLYPHGDKHNPIVYNGEIAVEFLAEFLEHSCKKGFISSNSIVNRKLSDEQLFERHTEL